MIFSYVQNDLNLCSLPMSEDTCSLRAALLNCLLFFSWPTEFIIMKTGLYNVDPLKPHFYIVKLGLQGYTLLFLFQLKNTDCGNSLGRGGSNEYPHFMF